MKMEQRIGIFLALGAVAALFWPLGKAQGQSPIELRGRLIGKHPGGACSLEWSRDGRFVRATPNDTRQAEWASLTFDLKPELPKPAVGSAAPWQMFLGAKGWVESPANFGKAPRWFIHQRDSTLSKELLISAKDREVRFWPMRYAPLSLDGQRFVFHYQGQVAAFDARSGRMKWRSRLQSENRTHYTATFSPDQLTLLGEDGRVFDAQTGRVKGRLTGWNGLSYFSSGFTRDGASIWSSTREDDGFLTTFWNRQTAQKRWEMTSDSIARPTPDNRRVGALDDQVFLVRDALTGRVQKRISGFNKEMWADFAWSPDGKRIVVSDESNNGEIREWTLP